ncbi:hypothetical protein H6P81_018045 [Aristolochia fimbriata]|uniref:Uncharacterized protein n=1 Tax=Aristolochia fimbriata TaxID=158543 RepID=A0AAV7E1D7_ARIFI|nr:hypothetical protein H6P81_018045 [Aristolochia fimbriata]
MAGAQVGWQRAVASREDCCPINGTTHAISKTRYPFTIPMFKKDSKGPIRKEKTKTFLRENSRIREAYTVGS